MNESEEKTGDIKIGDGNTISGVVGVANSNRNNTTNIHLHVEKTGNLLLFIPLFLSLHSVCTYSYSRHVHQ